MRPIRLVYIIIHSHLNEEDVHALPRDSIYGCVTFLLVQARTRIISCYATVQGKLHVVRIL